MIDRAPTTDTELLAAVARGDRQAYAALHRRFAAVLLGLVTRILSSRAEAEDVLQEVFLQIWKKAGDFDPRRGRVFPWLATLARNRAFDRLSVLNTRSRLVALRAPRDAVEESGADPVDEASQAENAHDVRRALEQIPDAQRAVLLLAYFQGLSQTEIARRLGTPLGSVKSNARLGLTKLRNLLRAGDLAVGARRR